MFAREFVYPTALVFWTSTASFEIVTKCYFKLLDLMSMFELSKLIKCHVIKYIDSTKWSSIAVDSITWSSIYYDIEYDIV